VTPLARDRWLHHFRAGLDAADLTPEQDQRFWEYAHHAAMFMVNTMDEAATDETTPGSTTGLGLS
jgi:hemoglobin